MRNIHAVALLVITVQLLSAQGQTTTNGKATASGKCSVAHSGNQDTMGNMGRSPRLPNHGGYYLGLR